MRLRFCCSQFIRGGGRQHYADETNIAYFLPQPDVLMLQALLLKFKPVDSILCHSTSS